MAKQVDPRKVTSIPEGYTPEVRNGKTVYVKKTQAATPSNSSTSKAKTKMSTPSVTTGAKNVTIKPKPRVSVTTPSSTFTEDVVYLDESIVPTPTISNIPLYEDKRIDRKLQAPINPNFDYYKYPDANAGYSKATDKFVDRATGKFIDAAKSMSTGTYSPSFMEDTTVITDHINLGTEKQGNPRVTTTPTITNVMEGVKKEKAGTKGLGTTMGTVGFAKGGIVSKIKGYTNGGTTGYEIAGLDSGVVGMNDQYSAQKAKEEQDTINEAKKKANQDKARGVANRIGEGMGGIGTAYYNSQPTQNDSEATRNAGLATTSQMGPIGGMIGGVAAFGDKIGKPIKKKSETLDSSGNLTNSNKSKMNAIGGSLFSPSKALAYRSESGNWGDVTGNQYNSFIEGKAKAQLAEVKDANAKAAQQQAILARNNGEENPTITNPYNLSGVTFDENQNMILADGQQFDPNRQGLKKGGIVSKIQMCSDGGKIVGKGTGKSDSILAKVEADSFIVPAKNAEVAEELREKYLGKPPKQKANLNDKNGELVKLSNGEHKFTPEEKHELLEKGVNVDLLAPDSKVKAVEKKSHIMFPNVIGLKDGGGIPDYKKMYSEKKVQKTGKTYEELITPPNSWTGTREEWKAAADKAIKEGKVEVSKSGKKGGLSSSDYAKMYASDKPKEVIEGVANTSGLRVPKTGTKVTVDNLPTKDLSLTGLKEEAELKANAAAIDSDKSIANAPTRQAVINDANKVNNGSYSNPTRKGGIMDKMGNMDPTSFVGIGQTALGLNMLGKSKRPIDNAKIDPTYNTAVNRAQQDALFGLTPEQRFAAEQDIQGGLNDAKMAGLNSSGVQSFNLNRAAINDAWRNKLGLKQADSEMRMNKQKYADAMVADRAGILASNRRQAYNDAMGTFQQNQSAGSELIGAGLQNTIGAYRYNKTKAQQDEENAMRNPWINYKA